MLTNSSMPYLDNSLPNPLLLTPPNGTLGSEATTLLTDTMPDSRLFENLCLIKVLRPMYVVSDTVKEEDIYLSRRKICEQLSDIVNCKSHTFSDECPLYELCNIFPSN
jgi:hypothetical protein